MNQTSSYEHDSSITLIVMNAFRHWRSASLKLTSIAVWNLIALTGSILLAADTATDEIVVGDYVRFESRGQVFTGPVIQATRNGRLLIVDVSVGDRKSSRQVMREECVKLRQGEIDSLPKPIPPASTVDTIDVSIPPLAEPGAGKAIKLINESFPTTNLSNASSVSWDGFKSGKKRINKPPFAADVHLPYVLDLDSSAIIYSVNHGRMGQKSTEIYVSTDEPSRYRHFHLQGVSLRIADTLPQHGVALGLILNSVGQSTGLCVFAGLTTSSPRVVSAWSLPKQKRGPLHCHYRRLLPDGSVVCVYENTLRVFDGRTGKLRWFCAVPPFFEPAISPGGRWLAVFANGRAFIVETSTGRCAGSIPNPGLESKQPCFSPDGNYLATYGQDNLTVTRLNDGKILLEHQANVNLAPFGGETLWTSPSVLITPAGYLIDLRSNLLAWRYRLPKDAGEWIGSPGSGWIPAISDEWLAFNRIPHQDVGQLAASVDVKDLVVLRPGDGLRIELVIKDDIQGDADRWRANLVNALETNGYKSDPSSSANLKVDVVRAAKRTDHYINFGTGKSESVTYSPWGARLSIDVDNEEVWKTTQSANLSHTIGGDLQRAAQRLGQPPNNLFQRLRLPPRILSKQVQEGLGQSKVSIDGVN